MGDTAGAFGTPARAAPPTTRELVTARPAATLMLVRDGDHPVAPLEVLMLRRSLESEFAGGAHVFPGGAVDPDDAGAEALRLSGAVSDTLASACLDVATGGIAYWVAAIRECFEEAGILLARRPDGTLVSFGEPSEAERFARHRDELNARRRRFLDLIREEQLTLAADEVHYFSHWVTPERAPRRFDTRFFVAPAPRGQIPVHDAAETIAHMWVRPADALASHRDGELDLIFPTIRSLQSIARFRSAAELLTVAAERTARWPDLTRMVADAHGRRIVLPGDPPDGEGPAEAVGPDRFERRTTAPGPTS